LIRVYLVFDRQLLDGITFFEHLKDDFGLKAVGKVSSFLFHSQQINILLFCCPIFLDHYNLAKVGVAGSSPVSRSEAC